MAEWGERVENAALLGTFCKPKFGNFNGNRPGLGEKWETKWRIFAKIHSNVRPEGLLEPLGAKFLVRFKLAGSTLPVWPVLWQFGNAGRRINFCSSCLFFRYFVIFNIVELYSVGFVFSSLFSSSEPQAISTKSSISPSVSEKVYFVSRKQRVRGREGGEERQRFINVVSFLLCPHPIHTPLSTLRCVKQFCCCLGDY